MLKRIVVLFHTVRYLKAIQLYWRIYLKLVQFVHFSISLNNPVACRQISLPPGITKYHSLSESEFIFLNEANSYPHQVHWNDLGQSKLWLYNLHYFDYLNQTESDRHQGVELVLDWITNNPVGIGNGWEPYPISLRIVNWIKFLCKPMDSNRETVSYISVEQAKTIHESLFLQSRYLRRHLEYHLLGNHLFKNGVALFFAGSYFTGSEAEQWLVKGKQILFNQLDEQILDDGGHFERSPMYHAIILEDLLDVVNMNRQTGFLSDSEREKLYVVAARMTQCLSDIVHIDGEIPFFNDSALGIASPVSALLNYAAKSSVELLELQQKPTLSRMCAKPDFGLYILQKESVKMVIDAGPIGPDYLPGHAHCDTLSYEMSIDDQRFIVNSGTYQYAGKERNSFRSTRAHNTVMLDEIEQHEIWSTFRVARRGYPIGVQFEEHSDAMYFRAGHTGYRRLTGKPDHFRSISSEGLVWEIKDTITGGGQHHAESFIHIHPDVKTVSLSGDGAVFSLAGRQIEIRPEDGLKMNKASGYYSSEFGKKRQITVLYLEKTGLAPFELAYRIMIH